MEFVGSSLQRREIVSKRPRNCFFQGTFERFGAFSQRILYPIGIMETRLDRVN
jgi:hypothetical protein